MVSILPLFVCTFIQCYLAWGPVVMQVNCPQIAAGGGDGTAFVHRFLEGAATGQFTPAGPNSRSLTRTPPHLQRIWLPMSEEATPGTSLSRPPVLQHTPLPLDSRAVQSRRLSSKRGVAAAGISLLDLSTFRLRLGLPRSLHPEGGNGKEGPV